MPSLISLTLSLLFPITLWLWFSYITPAFLFRSELFPWSDFTLLEYTLASLFAFNKSFLWDRIFPFRSWNQRTNHKIQNIIKRICTLSLFCLIYNKIIHLLQFFILKTYTNCSLDNSTYQIYLYLFTLMEQFVTTFIKFNYKFQIKNSLLFYYIL